MKQHQLNVQTTIFMFINLLFNLMQLFPVYLKGSRRPIVLFGLRFVICFLQFFFFMMLPKSAISFTKRRDFLSHNRIQQLKQNFVMLNFVSMFVALYYGVSVQQCVFAKLMQYQLIVLSPASTMYVVLNIVALVAFICFEEIVFRQSRIFLFGSTLLLLVFGFWQYFYVLSRAAQQIQVNYNINKEIDKIFAFRPTRVVRQEDSCSDGDDEPQQVFLDFSVASTDNDEIFITKCAALADTVQIIASVFGAHFTRLGIARGQLTFDAFLGHDLRHFAVCANIIEELTTQYEVGVIVVIGRIAAQNDELLAALDSGVYVTDISKFQYNITGTEEEALSEILEALDCMQRVSGLEMSEKQSIFKQVIRMLPPQFNIIALQRFEFSGAEVQLATLQPRPLCEYITQIFILKFEQVHLEHLQKQENAIDYEQICAEINQQLVQLFDFAQEEVRQALMFAKIETNKNCEVKGAMARADAHTNSKSQVLTARHQPQRAGTQQFSYMSKGDEYNENHICQPQAGSGGILVFFKALASRILYFIDVSKYLESQFAKHFLLKAALIKARPTYKSYFYIPIAMGLFLPIYVFFAIFEGFGHRNVHVLGFQMSYNSFLLLIFAEQGCAAFLQLLVCFSVFISAEKLFNNQNSSQSDAYEHILNFNNQKTLNYPRIGLGRKLTFYIYQNMYYLTQYQLYFAIQSFDVASDSSGYHTYQFMLTLPLFFNLLFQQFLSTIIALPEEFISLNFVIMCYHNIVFVVTGLLSRNADFVSMLYIVLVMLIYQFFQLREFICFGKQQEQNFNMLKLKNRMFLNKLSSFSMLVYNVLASKYVVLNSIIESNYIVRRARVAEENQDELNLKIGFYEKIYHYQAALRDKQQRQTCLIDYGEVVFAVFQPLKSRSHDALIDFGDFVDGKPHLYQLPLIYPNVCCFAESAAPQHLHNAFQIIIAFAEGAQRRFGFTSVAVAYGALRIFVLQNGEIHVSSSAISTCFSLLGSQGIVVDGQLLEKYKSADAKFRAEISTRVRRAADAAERERLLAVIWHLSVTYRDNGRSAMVYLKQ